MNKTIFISIAAQDDEELPHTIINLFKNADHPQNITVGVAITCMKKKNLKTLKDLSKEYDIVYDYVKQRKNDRSVLGIGRGRSRAAKLYNNHDFMIQIDCHTYFDSSWDSYLLHLFEEATRYVGDDKILLTAIPRSYAYCCSEHTDILRRGAKTRYPFYEPDHFFVDVIPKWNETDIINVRKDKFLPCAKVSPAFIMGGRDFATDPGIHEPATFYDEDLTQSVTLFDRGFAFVFPNVENLPVSHLDSDGTVKGHERYFLLDYLNARENYLLHENMKKEYIKFAKDPSNFEAAKKYRKYARVDLIKGCFVYNQDLVPKRFR